MHAAARLCFVVLRCWRQVVYLLLAASLWLSAGDAAWAQKKKKEVEAPPTKSYTVPYLIVLAMMGIGLMTVCRPTSRLDKPDEKKKDKEESE